MAFFDLRVFNQDISKRYKLNEKRNEQDINERISGMSQECNRFYYCLSEMISLKRGTPFNITEAWITIRRKIMVSLIKLYIL